MLGVFVGVSLALAQAMQLEKTCWVPVAAWPSCKARPCARYGTKQAHRVLGTGVGPHVSWGLLDTILGCLVGLLGGVCLRSPRFRGIVGRQIRRLIPSRFAQ